MPARPKLELPYVRRAVMIELATGRKTQTQIAGEYGVTQPSVSTFNSRHADEIQAIRDNALDEMTGIAIARKAARLEAYEEILRAALVPTPETAGKDGDYVRDPETGQPIMKIDAGVAAKILRNVAEELGHLPSRVVITGGLEVRTNYTLNGVNPENLK